MSVIMAELAEWDGFYLIIGSAAGALIGLQFVVLTLLAQKSLPKGAAQTGTVMLTPTIVHFGVALLVSALLRAPRQTTDLPLALLSIIGIFGAMYVGFVAFRMCNMKSYVPGLEDWTFHIVLPLVAYALMVLSSFASYFRLNEGLFGIGAAVLLLLFIGIHNAWDNIAYTVFVHDAELE
jgi:hypothetical protein